MQLADRQAAAFEQGMRSVIKRMQALIIANANLSDMMAARASERVLFAPVLYNAIQDALKQGGYSELAADLVNQDKQLIKAVRTERTAAGLTTAFASGSREVLDAFRNLELSKFDHIGAAFVDTLHGELMNYALTGISEADFIMNLQAALEGRFQKYAVTYANTSRAQFIQAVQDEAGKDEAERYWEYVGAEDDKNRDACIRGLEQRYFTDAEREAFETETAEERAWNCRHTFVEITKETYLVNTGA